MQKVQLYSVAPAIPAELKFLETLSYNLWWCWNHDAIELFRRINPQLWRDSGHNPLEFLGQVPQARLEALAHDDGFLRHQRDVRARYETEMAGDGTDGRLPAGSPNGVAYFSVEFGIHESIPMYSGGLGVLAGDHLKAASDMGVPMVAVSLLYRQGYFQQYLNQEGWQQETYPENEIHHMPLRPVRDPEGRPVVIEIPLPEGRVRARAWRLDVGRVPLFMLDANLPENSADFRAITAQLYVADRRKRLRQELLLGIGGYRLLRALGFTPAVCHMNEGHTAFVSLARAADLMREHRIPAETAVEIVARTSVFTTHTPVPAGNEVFATDLIRPHLDTLKDDLGLDPATILSWGQPPGGARPHEFSMTILGLRMAHHCNGVSELHGKVARRMWMSLWPGLPEDEIPIRHVTNGVHAMSWLSTDSALLYDRYLGSDWRDHPAAADHLSHVEQIPDEELWRAHEVNRSRLIRATRELLERQYAARNAPMSDLVQVKTALDHDALTIGFARRFAGYKRATLLLRDPHRLEALITRDDRPVQFLFAGKAHPSDDHGKDLIRQIVRFARTAKIRHRVVFIENYNIYVARCLVQGVDVWLNTPLRPQEASGTSGMKAALNGGLHASILDGWWAEAYTKERGWSIGHGDEYGDAEYQDTVESQALFNLIENEIVPTFYDRSSGEYSPRWVSMMKASIRMALSQFTSHRMVAEYQQLFYDPAANDYGRLAADGAAAASSLLAQRRRLESLWQEVRVDMPTPDRDVSRMHVGERFAVSTAVRLGQLRPDEVDVEVYYGPVNPDNRVMHSHAATMKPVGAPENGVCRYRGELVCEGTGRFAFTARARPTGADFRAAMPGFVKWANGDA